MPGWPMNAMLMAASANVTVSIGMNPPRAMSHARPNVPIVPPTCSTVPTSTAVCCV